MIISKNLTKKVQKALKAQNFYSGEVDGIFGPKTSNAIIAFKVSKRLKARDKVGPVTLKALGLNINQAKDISTLMAELNYPLWARVAYSYLGLKEIRGAAHNSFILAWWDKINTSFKNDETPWCAGYVGGILEECGLPSTESAMARSYTRYGQKLEEPQIGCIVVFWRKNIKSSSGHVGFVVGEDERGNLMVLGGNQNNEVNITPFSKSRVLSYHYPPNTKIPKNGLPLVKSKIKKLSQNEV